MISKDGIADRGIERRDASMELEALQASLYRYCISLTGSIPDAEDLAQQTWLKAIQSRKIESHVNPEAFLIRVAKNGWVDECRRRRMLRERIGQLQEAGGQPPQEDTEEADRAIAAIYRLMSPIQRTVFMLRDTLGYSIAETAELLDTSEGAVKAALHRARRTLEDVRTALLQDSEYDKGHVLGTEDLESEAMVRQVREAYVFGRTDELIRLLYVPQISAGRLEVIGWSVQSPSYGTTSMGPQASYSMLMSA
ncbi:RNA polymerase sigma factor [Paenibacillus agaridevorans]|uniref:RNA polymerase sigma factor n=1 Tax=Paenibacillus agaridevorans TaxID=171404 RepID=UPI001BE42E18|nr:RNA polymerase sigma factor [Paenibacillus agaridevorans]